MKPMRKRALGFTLVEVMTAVVVMTIGATGILAMQGASIQSNQDAFETSAAVNFGATWLERIKRDARLWTAPGNAALANTVYMRGLAAAASTAWFVPDPAVVGNALSTFESPAANFQGFDTVVTAANESTLRFCVNLRLTVAHAYSGLTGGSIATTDADAVRADVRVWWHRASDDANRRRKCTTAPLSEDEIKSPSIRKQYLSTVVRWRSPGWP